MTVTPDRPRESDLVPVAPRPSPLKSMDPIVLLVVNAVVIAYMWLVHGGLDRVVNDGWLIAIGQIAGLYGAAAALLALLLISRTPWIERRYGMDRMIHFHRYVGFTTLCLITIHVGAITYGYADEIGISVWEQIVDSYVYYPYVGLAFFGFGLFVVVAATSLRFARARLSYEQWWLIHLSAYVAVILAFGHQTAIGSDFALDGWAFAYWVLLYVSVAVIAVGGRWVVPLIMSIRHRFVVSGVENEGPDVVTVVVTGRHLDRLAVQSAQFFVLRVLDRRSFWKGHPFSVSAPPDGRMLRFTIKALGDHTRELQTIPVGTRVALEGPYGGFLPFRSTERKVLYIAGGVGITPFRGLLEDFERPQDVALLYRNRRPEDVIFLDDLIGLSERTGFLLGMSYSRIDDGDGDPLEPARLISFVPDISEREVFVVGSRGLIASARRGLRLAGVPARHIHYESFTF